MSAHYPKPSDRERRDANRLSQSQKEAFVNAHHTWLRNKLHDAFDDDDGVTLVIASIADGIVPDYCIRENAHDRDTFIALVNFEVAFASIVVDASAWRMLDDLDVLEMTRFDALMHCLGYTKD